LGITCGDPCEKPLPQIKATKAMLLPFFISSPKRSKLLLGFALVGLVNNKQSVGITCGDP